MKNNLKKIRESLGMSLAKMEKLTGCSHSHCWHLQKQTSSPNLYTAYKVAQVMGVSVYDIWPQGE